MTVSARTASPRRVAMLSVHTSPLDQPGAGDAGGMNVYMLEVARRLAERDTEVEIFTRTTTGDQPPMVEVAPGVTVRHVLAGPYEILGKVHLGSQLCGFTFGVLGAEAARQRGWYDIVHSHYWLSGQSGMLVSQRWDVPLVHSMHTMAKVKNACLADGDVPEPPARVLGEEQVVTAADRLVANTTDESTQLRTLYGAAPNQRVTVHPGVNLDVFTPGNRDEARARLGLPASAAVLLFAGRVQPLKAPDVLVRAVAELVRKDPALRRRLVVAVVGGPSGRGLAEPLSLVRLARKLGVEDLIRFEPPVSQASLADWYRAVDYTVVPSYSESFGLVALESQACGTPVVAAAVGGLRTAVRDGLSGVLVDSHDPQAWSEALRPLLTDRSRRAELSGRAVAYARRFSWDATADRMLEVYRSVCAERRSLRQAVSA